MVLPVAKSPGIAIWRVQRKKLAKNAPRFNLQQELQRVAGVDLTRIDGIDLMVAQTAFGRWNPSGEIQKDRTPRNPAHNRIVGRGLDAQFCGTLPTFVSRDFDNVCMRRQMSPCEEITTIEMSPNPEVSTGGQIGKDSDELQGVATSRGIGTSGKRRTKTGRCRSDFGA